MSGDPVEPTSLVHLRLLLGPTMDQPIIRIPAPGVVRIVFRHPDVKRVVKEQVGQHRTDDAALRCPPGTFYQGSVRQLQRRRQPAPDIQHGPFTLHVLLERLLQQCMVDVVKQAFDIKL